jgi:tRNA(adenine34) deaminase
MMQADLSDDYFMRLALEQAYLAQSIGEVPVGAVLVEAGQLLAVGSNRVIHEHDPSAHAEIIVLRMAGKIRSNYRLPHTTLYVTLEPCAMCVSAIFHARVERVVYGATDPKTGACGGNTDLRTLSINHHTHFEGGILQTECATALQDFFKERRAAAKALKALKILNTQYT